MTQFGTPQQRRTTLEGPSGSGGGVPGWLAFLVPAVAFGAFAAYAFLSPATYRATTLIAIERGPDAPLDLGDPSIAASRLRDAALESDAVLAASGEFGLGTSPTAVAEAKRRIETMLEVVPSGPNAFDVRLVDSEAERAQRLCNLLARKAAARASQVLGGVPPTASKNQTARAKSEQALREFLVAHPEVAPPVVAPAQSAKVKSPADAELAKLRLERDQLTTRIARIEKAQAVASDNPYADSPREAGDPQLLRRRIDEINSLLRRATERKPASEKIAPEIEREHRRLQAAVAQASAESPPTVSAVQFSVRLSEAGLPSSPAEPDRWLLLMIGAAVALVLAIVLWVLSSLSRRKRAAAAEGYGVAPDPRFGSDRPPGLGSDRPPGLGSDRPPGFGSDRPPGLGSDRPNERLATAQSDRPLGSGSDAPARVPSEPPGTQPQSAPAGPALYAAPVIGVSPAVAVPPVVPQVSTSPTAAAAPAVAPAPIRAVNAAVLPANGPLAPRNVASAAPAASSPSRAPFAPAGAPTVPRASNPPAATPAAPRASNAPAVAPTATTAAPTAPRASNAPAAAPTATTTAPVPPRASTNAPAAAPIAPTTAPNAPAAAPAPAPAPAPAAAPAPAPAPAPAAAPVPPRTSNAPAVTPSATTAPPPAPGPSAPHPSNSPAQTLPFGRSTTLSGFAIVPAPIRTPLPAALPDIAVAPVPAVAPSLSASSSPEPRSSVSPTIPPPPLVPAQHASEHPLAQTLSSNPAPAGPSHAAEVLDAHGNVARRKTSARTTQMLGSPIPPVMRQPASTQRIIESTRQPTRESVRPGTTRPSNVPDSQFPSPQQPRPSGYSYVSTPPPEARPARRSSGPQWEEGKSYLSTPVPADPRAEPPTDASASPNTIVAHRLHSGWTLDPRIDAESRRSIADQLFPLAVERCFVLGITAVPDTRTEKSRVAAEIALALAEARHPRVLLLEGDFQWPTLHTLLNIEMPRAAGVSQQVRNHGSGHASQWSVVEVGRSLHVMAEGLMRSPGLMLSSMFEDSLRYFRRHYDFIVIDGPMASAEVDCRAFDSLIDGVAIVSSATSADWLTRAHMLFPDKRFSTVLSV